MIVFFAQDKTTFASVLCLNNQNKSQNVVENCTDKQKQFDKTVYVIVIRSRKNAKKIAPDEKVQRNRSMWWEQALVFFLSFLPSF